MRRHSTVTVRLLGAGSALYFLVVIAFVGFDFRLDVHPDAVTSSPTIITSGRSAANRSGNVDAIARHVGQCYVRHYGNFRAGNHLFALAAMLYVAARTGRTVIARPRGWCLDAIFDLSWVQRYNDTTPEQLLNVSAETHHNSQLCPCNQLFAAYKYNGEERLLMTDGARNNTDIGTTGALNVSRPSQLLNEIRQQTFRTLLLCGGHQTYFYPDQLGPALRRRLQFKRTVQQAAWRILNSSRPADWKTGSYIRVGVHLRRGDFRTRRLIRYGLTVASVQYINNSMRYFISRHRRVQFLVASNDLEWPRRNFPKLISSGDVFWKNASEFENLRVNSSVVVTLSTSNSAGVDMALLASCDANIISTGSFSWWTAWLANKTTIYYDRYPLNGTEFADEFSRSSYYPERWIPMT